MALQQPKESGDAHKVWTNQTNNLPTSLPDLVAEGGFGDGFALFWPGLIASVCSRLLNANLVREKVGGELLLS